MRRNSSSASRCSGGARLAPRPRNAAGSRGGDSQRPAPRASFGRSRFRRMFPGLLRPGRNVLEVKVTNLWNNRLMGDLLDPGQKPYARTNMVLKPRGPHPGRTVRAGDHPARRPPVGWRRGPRARIGALKCLGAAERKENRHDESAIDPGLRSDPALRRRRRSDRPARGPGRPGGRGGPPAVLADLGIPQQESHAAVAARREVRHLHPLGRLRRAGGRAERHLVFPQHLHETGLAGAGVPRSDLRTAREIRLQGLHPDVHREPSSTPPSGPTSSAGRAPGSPAPWPSTTTASRCGTRRYSEWNAAKMGPKRDIVGELSVAIKKAGLKFVTAFHHAENWYFFPTWDKRYDCGDPRYSGLYGPIHEKGAQPDKAFLDRWAAKVREVVDKYRPDFLWFDFGLGFVPETYKKELLAHFFNTAAAEGRDVVVSYKDHDLPVGVGINDLELGQEQEMTYHEWITDSSVDNQGAWGYVRGAGFKTTENLVHNLMDRISKNGYLLLNVGPKPDGTIPGEAREILLGMGRWLEVNGEAVYGTRPWIVAGEGPTKLDAEGAFNEKDDLRYKAQDIRFTAKGDVLYATALGWPGERILIKSLAGGLDPGRNFWNGLYPSEIVSVSMLGDGRPLKWEMTKDGMTIETPPTKPCAYAYVFKIVRRMPF
ncbi:MAG: alpha-L-fucosidase [Marinilabiliales bacterium]|nr:alpha-L-fucosidase [Marinilabiliales bacterium]